MRRILRKIAENDFGNLGDTSTLADPGVVDDLVKNRAQVKLGVRWPTRRSSSSPQTWPPAAPPRASSPKKRSPASRTPRAKASAPSSRSGATQALAAADASDVLRKAGHRRLAARRHPGLDQEPLRRGRRDDARRLEGARRRAAGQRRCAGGGAPARGRRGDRRQHQHERVRLLGRRLQPALRHAGQSGRPQARARRLVGGAAVSVADRMAVAALGTDTGGSVRIPAAVCGIVGFSRRRGGCRSTAWCRSRPRSI